jgi:predicted alpha/beta-fold hydrolase
VPAPEKFQAPIGLANPHVQTILSSLGRKTILPKREADFIARADEQCYELGGVRLVAHEHVRRGAPLVIIIPGWLGNSRSSYVLSAAKSLWNEGFSIARINLRDHGGTAHLNEGLFHSALIDEVVTLVEHLREQHGGSGTGVLGYSLGGNFALRIARRVSDIVTLSVCPALSPAETMCKIEESFIYQRYFVRKWRNLWRAKQAAFPSRYDFGDAMRLSTISALTDYFVRYHTDFSSTGDYFDAYDLTGAALDGVQARVLATHDDPIIPAAHYGGLPASLEVDMVDRGGHGAFLETWNLDSWADRYAIDYFRERIGV